ncbi:MAG: hypothetical protein J1F28_02890 [Oscillospiraceae bacterium]|nr:hypothetical protein [Oscillospiraceae bacterium]
MEYLWYIIAALGAGIDTGFEGLSAATVMVQYLSCFALALVVKRLDN